MTYIRTWVGFTYLALVIDVFSRRIVGRPPAGHYPRRLWRSAEALELALFEYLDRWNNSRLHGEVGMHTPAEVEAQHYAQTPAAAAAGSQ